MDAAAELGRNPVSQIQPEYGDEQADAGRDCRTRLAKPNFRHERGQGNNHFSCSADHVQDWQPYPVDPYSCYMCDHTYIHTQMHFFFFLRTSSARWGGGGALPDFFFFFFSLFSRPRAGLATV